MIQQQGDGFPLDQSRVAYLRFLRRERRQSPRSEAEVDHVKVKTEMPTSHDTGNRGGSQVVMRIIPDLVNHPLTICIQPPSDLGSFILGRRARCLRGLDGAKACLCMRRETGQTFFSVCFDNNCWRLGRWPSNGAIDHLGLCLTLPASLLIDGDTFGIHGTRIRLRGIDAIWATAAQLRIEMPDAKILFPASVEAAYFGIFVAFRTIVPMGDVTADVRRDIVALWGGPGFHIVHYPLRHGPLFNIAAVFRRSDSSERGDVTAYRMELEHAYRCAHPTMKAFLSRLDLGRGQAVGDRDPIRHWHKGRVVLLGDASHQNQACNRQCKNYAYLRGSRLDVSRDARLTVILLASAAHQAQHHHEQVYEVEVER